MSIVGQPLTIAELIEYMEQHKRGTIDDEVIGRLKQLQGATKRGQEFMCELGLQP